MARCAAGNKLYGLVPAQGAVCCLVSHRVGARTGLQLLRFADYPSEQRPGHSSVRLVQWMVFFVQRRDVIYHQTIIWTWLQHVFFFGWWCGSTLGNLKVRDHLYNKSASLKVTYTEAAIFAWQKQAFSSIDFCGSMCCVIDGSKA